MTPEQAMLSKFANDTPADDRPTLKLLLDGIAATAKKNETRRCVTETNELAESNKVALCDSTGDVRCLLRVHANDLLTTGGLEITGERTKEGTQRSGT